MTLIPSLEGMHAGRLAALLAGGLLLAGPLVAQEQERPPVYTFRALAWDGSARLHYTSTEPRSTLRELEGAGETPSLRVPARPNAPFVSLNKSFYAPASYRSERQSYSGPATIQFFPEPPRTVVEEGAEGEQPVRVTTPDPVAEVTLPNPNRPYLLLFFKRDEPDERGMEYGVIALDEAISSFPEGSYRFVNLSERDFVLSFNRQRVDLPARKMRSFNPGVEQRRNLRLMIIDREVSQNKPVYSNLLNHLPDHRYLVFVRNDDWRHGGVRFKIITERADG